VCVAIYVAKCVAVCVAVCAAGVDACVYHTLLWEVAGMTRLDSFLCET